MKNFFTQLLVTDRLFYALGIVTVLFASGFFLSWLTPVSASLLLILLLLSIVDAVLLFRSGTPFEVTRRVSKMLSLSDENEVAIEMENKATTPFQLRLIDEVPEQFQQRHFTIEANLKGGEHRRFIYSLRPVERGRYLFGNLNILFSSVIGLLKRKVIIDAKEETAVYPSIKQMKEHELKTLSRISMSEGIKRLRRIGHSYEFEETKEYVLGDDSRSINWKASSRRNALMVNQYEDERAQQVYCAIDKSRSMLMPFNGMSLLDYSINSTLSISNIALHKTDKAGLVTFASTIQTFLKAVRNRSQLRSILEALYSQQEEDKEANFEALYFAARYYLKGRSLLFLYTNFESQYSLERILPILRRINELHLLVVIFFRNSELEKFSMKNAESLQDIYDQTIAQKFIAEKSQLVTSLRRYGIQSIFTTPEELSINTINKYLEIKAKGMI